MSNRQKFLCRVGAVIACGVGSAVNLFAQAGDGTLGGATNNTAEVPIVAGIANTAVSVFYVVLPAGLVVGLAIWGYMKFKKVAK